ncbi:MAG: hypothetical protein R3B70_16580 [Polyangiaceae bacterium]
MSGTPRGWTAAVTLAAAASMSVVACGESFVASGSGGGGAGGTSETTSAATSGGNGGTAGSTGEGGGAACAAPASSACADCLYTSCEDIYCACVNEPACVGLGTCLNDGKPVEFCWQQNADGIAIAGRLQACGAQKCEACSYDDVPPCLDCQLNNGPAEVNACFSSGDCLAYLKCVDDCGGDAGCAQGCGTTYPKGQAPAGNLIECIKGSCVAACSN